MEKTLTKFGTFAFIVIAMIATILTIMNFTAQKASASAPSGLPASVATSSQLAVSTTPSMLTATTTYCSATIVTSRAQPLMITFSQVNGAIPTATFGHLQAASTTVAYDSGLYGCGAFNAYAYGADSITVTRTN